MKIGKLDLEMVPGNGNEMKMQRQQQQQGGKEGSKAGMRAEGRRKKDLSPKLLPQLAVASKTAAEGVQLCDSRVRDSLRRNL